MTHKNFVQCPSKDSWQSTFQKELEDYYSLNHRRVFAAQSKALEAFEKDMANLSFCLCRDNKHTSCIKLLRISQIKVLAQKHFKTGGK